MKHVTASEKSLYMDDEAADLLLRYALALEQSGTSATIELNALQSDGEPTRATLLLDDALSLVAETIPTAQQAPDNADAIATMRVEIERLDALRSPSADDITGREVWNNAP